MAKFWDITVKNLKEMFRNKSTYLFLIGLPIFYYCIMGFLWGGAASDSGGYIYSVGWVNYDTGTVENPANPFLNNTFIYETIESMESFSLTNYSTNYGNARDNLAGKGHDALLVIPDGFQSYLNESNQKRFAFYNNDTTSTYDPAHPLYWVSNITRIQATYMKITDITGQDWSSFLGSFNESAYDYIVVYQDGFADGLQAETSAQIDFFARNNTDEALNQIQGQIFLNSLESIIFDGVSMENRAAIDLSMNAVPDTSPKPIPTIQIVFRTSTEATMRQVLKSTLESLIDGIINYDPNSIPLDFADTGIEGELVNEITIGTPGYIMYGLLAILSSATIMITQEKQTGTLKRLESSRMKASDMLIGHIISNTVTVWMQFAVGITVLSLFGFQPQISGGNLLSMIFGVFITVNLASFFLNALALVAAAIFKSPDSSAGGVWIFLIPLMMFSGAFFPLELVAPSLIPYVAWLPTRMIVVLLQDFLVNGVLLSSPVAWIWIGALAAEGVLVFVLGLRLYHRFVQK